MFDGDGIGIKNLELALARWSELNTDAGIATAGANTTVSDTRKNWPVNQWVGGLVKIIKANGQEYSRVIASNTATQITFAALPGGVVVAADDFYSVRVIGGGGGAADVTDRWNRQLGQIDIARVLGAALAHANPVIARLTTGAGFDINLTTLSRLQRWGRDIDPAWVHAAEVVAPAAGTALVTQVVGAGVSGYIYGFFISAQEANDFLINWTSGGAPYSKRIIFGGGGVVQDVETVALNEGLPADTGTNVTITNVNAAAPLKVYQANLLYVEV
jgi:hypothetical protein